jgi:cyclomaltodextrinase
MTVPEWVQDSIFYQIFPDRFCNGSVENDPKNVHSWSAMPTISGFQGGDIRGIIERVYYLMDLGVNAIYLNPIFLSPSNHRYNAVDYYQIDPKLGTKTEFLSLLDIAHRNNMKIILDGVFNHCGRGFLHSMISSKIRRLLRI